MARKVRLLISIVVSLIAAIAVALPGAVSGGGVTADRRPTPTFPGPVPSPKPHIVILSVGDSLTYGGGLTLGSYRLELDRLLGMTAQPHTWVVQAVGGTKCSYWAVRLDALITQYNPGLILLNCGTNDVPGTDNTEAAYRSMLGIAQARGVKLVGSTIGIPDMKSDTNRVRPYILDWHWQTTQAILQALAAFPAVRWADMTRMAPNPEFYQTDGIHLNQWGEAVWGQLFYQAAQPVMGWWTLQQLGTHEMCGMSGSWPWEPWPTDYIVCRS